MDIGFSIVSDDMAHAPSVMMGKFYSALHTEIRTLPSAGELKGKIYVGIF